MRERETRAAFCLVLNLARFETLERERDFAFDRGIGPPRWATPSSHHLDPAELPAGSGPEALACCLGHR